MTRSTAGGRVILVGAGPGAPDLITLRGEAALRRADVVVYDALAPAELIARAPENAERIDVGKRGHQEPIRSQEEIHALLIARARQGKVVVRLKGGDPFVFGRGGEEMTACFEAGVPVEVVPGVSSLLGALAYAGIPLTDRRHAASFAVVTGHKDPSLPRERIRWGELARGADTLVILMGMKNLASIVDRLVAGGRDPRTPAAVVMEGTTPRQRVLEANLGELPKRVEEAGLAAPAVVVVGDVVTLRERMRWFEDLPLFGLRVLVTRGAEQAEPLLDALRSAGAEPLSVPMIRIEPPEDFAPVDAALSRLADFDTLLFTSANAVRRFAARAEEVGASLGDTRAQVVCVGPATGAAALAAGLPVHLVPEARFDAEGMLDAIARTLPPSQSREGRHFLLPRAAEAREVLPEGLRAAGARVEAVTVYRTLPAEVEKASLRGMLVRGELDVLTFASPSALRSFDGMLDDASRAAARRCILAAIGPVTAAALDRAGYSVDVMPERAEGGALLEALSEFVAARRREGSS